MKIQNKLTVINIFNTAGNTNIGLENFAYIKDENIEKHIILVNQSKVDGLNFIEKTYPNSNIDVHSIFSKNKSSNNFFILLVRLFQVLRKLKPDIVHIHHTKSALLASILKRIITFNLVITAHSTFNRYSLVQKVSFLFSYLTSDTVVCNSKNTFSNIPSIINNKKKRLIYNGVNFKEIDRLSIVTNGDDNIIQFGTVSRMIPEKDHKTLINSFARLVKDHDYSHLRLNLIGDGPLKSRLIQLTKDLMVEDYIRFFGNLSREETYKQLGNLDIFVVSSRYEGFCNAMVEASAASIAIVATNIKPLPEVVGEKNALFFEVGDIDSLILVLKKLCDDKNLRESLGKAASNYVRSRYPLDKSANEYAQLYKEMML